MSPDGTRLAMFQSYKGRKTLVTTSLREGEIGPIYPISFQEVEYSWFRWLNNDQLAVSVRFPGKRFGTETMETRFLSMNWNGSDAVNLVKTQRMGAWRSTGDKWASQYQDDVVSFLPDDPDHILLALDSFESMNEPDVYKVNIHDADRSRVVRTRGSINDWYADQKGVVRLGIGYNRRNRERIIYRKSEDDGWKTIAKYDLIEDDIPFVFEQFSSDPNIIFVSAVDENGRKAYYKYDLDAGDFAGKIAGSDEGDVGSLDIDEEGNLQSYHYDGAKPVTVYTDKHRQAIDVFFAKKFPDETVRIISASKDKRKYIVEVTSPQNPGDFYLLDLDKKTMNGFAEKYPGLDHGKLAPMKPVIYAARDGLEIPGYLSLPVGKDPKKLPTVIMPHGGPNARDNWEFDYWVQLLTTRGYAVLQMNYRGSTGFGVKFENLGDQEWGGKMLDDINDGTRWMIEQGYADPDNICIMGGSYGGYAALQAPVKEQGLYKCAVALAPVTDMSSFMFHERKYVGFQIYRHYIRNDELSYDDMSPHENIDKINFPVLVAHGTDDRRVPFDQGEDFAKKMKKEKKDITFLKFEDGDHHLSREEHRVKFLKAVEKFLGKHLGGGAD